MHNQKGFVLPILIIVSLLILAVVAYFFSPKQISSVSVKTPTNLPKANTLPTHTPDPAIANWKVFKDVAFLNKDSIYNAYQVRYPENCTKKDYKILECILANSSATIILNAGGHGSGDESIKVLVDNVSRKYPSGEGKFTEIELINKQEIIGTFWFDKTEKAEYYGIWGLEFYGVSKSDLDEFNLLIEMILNSVEFIE